MAGPRQASWAHLAFFLNQEKARHKASGPDIRGQDLSSGFESRGAPSRPCLGAGVCKIAPRSPWRFLDGVAWVTRLLSMEVSTQATATQQAVGPGQGTVSGQVGKAECRVPEGRLEAISHKKRA